MESPPFGLYDIFNYLIYHSADYDKQGLASYKSYDDYRLFDDDYMESLSTLNLNECGVHIYVGKVYPTMRMKTDEGKNCYDLWFILEGKGPNCGSVLAALCKCKGGRDGGCKHIAAAMCSHEFLLNTQGKDCTVGISSKHPTNLDHCFCAPKGIYTQQQQCQSLVSICSF